MQTGVHVQKKIFFPMKKPTGRKSLKDNDRGELKENLSEIHFSTLFDSHKTKS